MGLTWGRQDPGGTHVDHVNLTIWGVVSCTFCWFLDKEKHNPYFWVFLDSNHISTNVFCAFLNYGIHKFLSYVIFRQSYKSWLTELVGEYKNADRVSLLDGRVIWVQILQECEKRLVCGVWDSNLDKKTTSWSQWETFVLVHGFINTQLDYQSCVYHCKNMNTLEWRRLKPLGCQHQWMPPISCTT